MHRHRLTLCVVLALVATCAAADPPHPGEHCSNAIPVAVPSIITGSTALYGSDPDPTPCGPGSSSPSIWFAVTGTGSTITANTCLDTFFDAVLVVFAGSDCATLQCIVAVDDSCSLQPIVQWQTQAGMQYRVVLRGLAFSGGLFTLQFEGSGGEDCDADGVPDAQEIVGDPSLDCFGPAPAGEIGGPDGRLDGCQCAANWNRDGVVNSTDISTFLASWLTATVGGTVNADVDCSGSTNSADIAAFLTRWLAAITDANPTDGCP